MSNLTLRTEAADAVAQALDPVFFDACGHPVRTAILRRLIVTGAADIAEIARPFSQDRSVISRHLAILERSGVAVSERRGRRMIYDLNGPAIIERLETLLEAVKALASVCCPPEAEAMLASAKETPHDP